MSHRKYDYQGRKYIFYTAKYKEYFELFRNKNNNFRKLDLDRLIAEKCSYDVETVKKWRNSGESGSTPSDMEAVQIIADIFGVSVL